jgi:putative endonuclease
VAPPGREDESLPFFIYLLWECVIGSPEVSRPSGTTKIQGMNKVSTFLFQTSMKHFVYIIYSPSKNRFYVGVSVNPEERLLQHNNGFYESSSTKYTNDWVIFLSIECQSKTQALKFEKFIKK